MTAEPFIYRRTVEIPGAGTDTLRALTTLAGIRSWWSPIVTGSCEPGAWFTVGFEGLEEQIQLRVEPSDDPTQVRWICLQHSSAPRWIGSEITFTVTGSTVGTSLSVEHHGVPAAEVAAGWERFLRSIVQLLKTGVGEPFRDRGANRSAALTVALRYHECWTGKNFQAARALLADDLSTDVPINRYANAEDFTAAVASFGGAARSVELIASFGADDEALLLYDVSLPDMDQFRIAEHFTVADGRITHIRHVHDTAALAAPRH